jgi:group I intron endonuclease
MYKVYKIVNIVNNKIYIGYTKQDLEKRYHQHITCGSRSGAQLLKNAILKYGRENFKIEILKEYNDRKSVIDGEKFWIKTLNPEYNIHEGGQGGPMFGNMNGMYGKTHSIETKIKMSLSHQGSNNYMHGKTHSYDVRKKISEARKGKPGWNKGKKLKPLSEETKAKMRKPRPSLQGRIISAETRLKMSESRKLYFERKKNVK